MRRQDAVDRLGPDGLIGPIAQFKEWLKDQERAIHGAGSADMAHVWPLWRQNVADLVPRLFQTKK